MTGNLRRLLRSATRPAERHEHDLSITGPEGRETYTCATCPWTYQRARAPRPPVGKAF